MTTEPITLKNILRGQELEEVLTLVNSEKISITYTILGEGETKDWLSFYKSDDPENIITEIDVPARQHIKIIAKIDVPQDSPNGKYEGKIVITTKPKEESGNNDGITLALRVERDLLIEVTDTETIEFSTAVIPLKYSIKKGDPLEVRLIYRNEGNVSIKPNVEMKVKKSDETVFTAIYPYPEGEDPIKPFEQKELNYIKWTTTGQEKGEHIVEINIKLGDELIEEHSFSFNIGRDASYYLGALAGLGSGSLGIILIGIGILLMGIFFIRTFVFKKRDWEKPMKFVRSMLS